MPYLVEIEDAEGGHGGGDPVLLDDVLGDPPPEPFRRRASHVDGAWSILTGIAANTSIRTGQPSTSTARCAGLRDPIRLLPIAPSNDDVHRDLSTANVHLAARGLTRIYIYQNVARGAGVRPATSGSWGRVVWAIDAIGESSARKFHSDLDQKDRTKIQAQFNKLADKGWIPTKERFRNSRTRKPVAVEVQETARLLGVLRLESL